MAEYVMIETATRARQRYENDARFRMIAQSVVAAVMHEHGPVNPENADREAHDIALRTAVLLQERLFEGVSETCARIW